MAPLGLSASQGHERSTAVTVNSVWRMEFSNQYM
jgi:hypothetical protein